MRPFSTSRGVAHRIAGGEQGLGERAVAVAQPRFQPTPSAQGVVRNDVDGIREQVACHLRSRPHPEECDDPRNRERHRAHLDRALRRGDHEEAHGTRLSEGQGCVCCGQSQSADRSTPPVTERGPVGPLAVDVHPVVSATIGCDRRLHEAKAGLGERCDQRRGRGLPDEHRERSSDIVEAIAVIRPRRHAESMLEDTSLIGQPGEVIEGQGTHRRGEEAHADRAAWIESERSRYWPATFDHDASASKALCRRSILRTRCGRVRR